MTGLELLSTDNPWPQEKPDFPSTDWGWGIGGGRLLMDSLPENCTTVLEIGTLLGASARFFADAITDLTVICIDSWSDLKDRPLLKHVEHLTPYLNDYHDSIFNVFLASNWAYKDRIIPLRGFSPERLLDVYRAGVQPSLVYVDSSHEYEQVLIDFCTCHTLFPETVLTLDDWTWESVRTAVQYFANLHNMQADHDGNTWVLRGTAERIEELPASQVADGPVRNILAWCKSRLIRQ